MSTAQVSRRSTIVIPNEIPELLDFRPSQEFEFIGVACLVRLVPKVRIKNLVGSAKGASRVDDRD